MDRKWRCLFESKINFNLFIEKINDGFNLTREINLACYQPIGPGQSRGLVS